MGYECMRDTVFLHLVFLCWVENRILQLLTDLVLWQNPIRGN